MAHASSAPRLLASAAILLYAAVACALDASAQRQRGYMDAVAATLDAERIASLQTIANVERRDLAMIHYLRAGKDIASRWSWSAARIQEYEGSAEYAAAMAEIEKISTEFTTRNPRYVLYANTRVRSLEEQLRRWQENKSVGVAARELIDAVRAELARGDYPDQPKGVAFDRFKGFLTSWRPVNPPTLAAPGLSQHGQGRAYDFQIQDLQGRLIAGTDSTTIGTVWDEGGWTEKLSKAVNTASQKFVGPLKLPREPWHYEYRP